MFKVRKELATVENQGNEIENLGLEPLLQLLQPLLLVHQPHLLRIRDIDALPLPRQGDAALRSRGVGGRSSILQQTD